MTGTGNAEVVRSLGDDCLLWSPSQQKSAAPSEILASKVVGGMQTCIRHTIDLYSSSHFQIAFFLRSSFIFPPIGADVSLVHFVTFSRVHTKCNHFRL
jgi:hypothetical protein